MSYNDDSSGAWILILFIVAFVFFIGGAIFGTNMAEKAMQREAVLKNHGAWVTSANGDAVFEWKSAK